MDRKTLLIVSIAAGLVIALAVVLIVTLGGKGEAETVDDARQRRYDYGRPGDGDYRSGYGIL